MVPQTNKYWFAFILGIVLVSLVFYFHTEFDIEYNFALKDTTKSPPANETLKITFLTAFDDFYIQSAMRFCSALKNHPEIWPLIQAKQVAVVAYLLKSSRIRSLIDMYRKRCPFVVLKKVDYSNSSKYFQNAKQYRWKPYIIKRELEKSEILFWFDSSIVFNSRSHESFKDIITSLKTTYPAKCGIRVLTETGHTINAATHPDMYKYFNVSDKAKHMWMPAASAYAIIKTEKSKKVIDRLYQCAMEEGCMGPRGAALYCLHEKLWEDIYAGCHRFDQSALGLALGECTDTYENFAQKTDFLVVSRLYA